MPDPKVDIKDSPIPESPVQPVQYSANFLAGLGDPRRFHIFGQHGIGNIDSDNEIDTLTLHHLHMSSALKLR